MTHRTSSTILCTLVLCTSAYLSCPDGYSLISIGFTSDSILEFNSTSWTLNSTTDVAYYTAIIADAPISSFCAVSSIYNFSVSSAQFDYRYEVSVVNVDKGQGSVLEGDSLTFLIETLFIIFEVSIIPDDFVNEMNWQVDQYNDISSEWVELGSGDSTEYRAQLGNGIYRFGIFDVQSDGLCCAGGDGNYTLRGDNVVFKESSGQYGASDYTYFNVSEGALNVIPRYIYDGLGAYLFTAEVFPGGNRFGDVKWKLEDRESDTELLDGVYSGDDLYIPDGKYKYILTDYGGDGLCCGGSFELFVGAESIYASDGEYGGKYVIEFSVIGGVGVFEKYSSFIGGWLIFIIIASIIAGIAVLYIIVKTVIVLRQDLGDTDSSNILQNRPGEREQDTGSAVDQQIECHEGYEEPTILNVCLNIGNSKDLQD